MINVIVIVLENGDYWWGVTDQIAGEDTLLSPISSSADVLLEVVATRSGLEALLVQGLEAVSSRKISLKVEGGRQFSWPGCFRNYLKQSQDGFGMWRTTFGHVLPLQKLELN